MVNGTARDTSIASHDQRLMNSLHAVVHEIGDPSEWPPPVKGIAQSLGRPLPAYLSTAPYPFVSAGAVDLLQELSYSSCLRVTQEDNRVLHGRPLMDVFDIVISTVSDIRELVKWRDDGCPRPTVPLWSSLIRALGYACSDTMSIM
jgi:hypothetical protein